jgi:hypothetical protein
VVAIPFHLGRISSPFLSSTFPSSNSISVDSTFHTNCLSQHHQHNNSAQSLPIPKLSLAPRFSINLLCSFMSVPNNTSCPSFNLFALFSFPDCRERNQSRAAELECAALNPLSTPFLQRGVDEGSSYSFFINILMFNQKSA